GDTTRGPLCISVQIMGQVPVGKALKRSGAKMGDDIWISGKLGDAALALNHLLSKHPLTDDDLAQTLPALLKPEPRVELGLALRGIAHSAIDISDGLLADLGHILKASKVGATLNLTDIPCSDFLHQRLNHPLLRQMLLAGGDDYELCFTAPEKAREQIKELAESLNLRLSRVGKICNGDTLIVTDTNGNPIEIGKTGFDHFNR
ncbi:MAG: thiamine-phosphate kinase, partial [Nitrosomonadales bacterium]|nr:thiamine-phosphate kinase [Nitrosomonadales bacterium]